MIWSIYTTTALAAALLVWGFFSLRFKRLETEDRPRAGHQPIFIRLLDPPIQMLAHYNRKLGERRLDQKYGKRLVISGNPLHLVPLEFMALKELGAIAGLLLGLYITLAVDLPRYIPLLSVAAGFFLPDLWLNETITRRKHHIFLSLPFTMDLLTLAVEAGLTFVAAIEKVVEKGDAGPIREEFEKLLQDLRLGVNSSDALMALAERTDMYEIRSFSSALVQADKLGTPIGKVLRSQSDIRRTDRFQRAEKMAQEAPVKMLFPLLFFIFPAVFIIILAPIFLKFMAEGV